LKTKQFNIIFAPSVVNKVKHRNERQERRVFI